MRTLFTIFSILLINSTCFSQTTPWKNKKYFTLVSYNVENLFDTINNPHTFDEEFTPEGKKNWNDYRYNDKLNQLAKVISSINTKELPELIGLTEVENKAVLIDLANNPLLQQADYSVILDDGPDPRGIDCALMYKPSDFNYLNHKQIAVSFPFLENKRTRNILYVKGIVKKDTLHVFVNHWSSRRGGQKESEPKRMQSAKVLKSNIDSIHSIHDEAKIIVMGDFNDEPSNNSLVKGLQADSIASPALLKNLMYQKDQEGKGTYYYKGNFNMLDHLIVSKSLLNSNKGFRLLDDTGYIYSPEFICYTHKNGDKAPSRSYGGPKYYGGFSDHFPIYTIFRIK